MSDFIAANNIAIPQAVLTVPQTTGRLTIAGTVSVDPDGTIHCLQPRGTDVTVFGAGPYTGLMRALWLAGKCAEGSR